MIKKYYNIFVSTLKKRSPDEIMAAFVMMFVVLFGLYLGISWALIGQGLLLILLALIPLVYIL